MVCDSSFSGRQDFAFVLSVVIWSVLCVCVYSLSCNLYYVFVVSVAVVCVFSFSCNLKFVFVLLVIPSSLCLFFEL